MRLRNGDPGRKLAEAGTHKVPELVSRMASLTPADLGAP